MNYFRLRLIMWVTVSCNKISTLVIKHTALSDSDWDLLLVNNNNIVLLLLPEFQLDLSPRFTLVLLEGMANSSPLADLIL